MLLSLVGLLATLDSNMHFGKVTLVAILAIVRSQWVLQKLQVVFEVACEADVELGDNLVIFFIICAKSRIPVIV